MTRRILMRIAYLTTDDVNLDLALELAESQGITLCPRTPRDAAAEAPFDAVLYDWDYWPVELRAPAIAEWHSTGSPCPVAIHSYNLNRGQINALLQQGIAIFRTLGADVFRFLRQAIIASRVASACGADKRVVVEENQLDDAA
jgi:hypothetical protein